MTRDVVALVREAPDVRAVVAGMVEAGSELRVLGRENGAVIQLCDDEESPLVSIEAPQLIRVSGEVARLLDREAEARVPAPLWWVEARASSSRQGCEELARRFADELVRRLDGLVWVDSVGIVDGPAPTAEQADPATAERADPATTEQADQRADQGADQEAAT